MKNSFADANRLLREKKYTDALRVYRKLINDGDLNPKIRLQVEKNINYIKNFCNKNKIISEAYRNIKRTLRFETNYFSASYKTNDLQELPPELMVFFSNPPEDDLDLFKLAFIYCTAFDKSVTRLNDFERHVENRFCLGFFDEKWITAPRLAFLASYPKRIEILKSAIAKSKNIFDLTFVSLNEFKEIPKDFIQPGVVVKIQEENLADNGKFYSWFPKGIHDSYIFTIDDDIDYPDDYCLTLSLAARRYDNKCVVGLHGVVLKNEITSYYKSRFTYNFKTELPIDLPVDILGTGTVCYWSEALSLDQKNFTTKRMVDLWFALTCQQKGIPLICLSRKSGYLDEHDSHQDTIHETSIYTQDSNADEHVEFNLLALALSIKKARDENQKYFNDHLKNKIILGNTHYRKALQQAITRYIHGGYKLTECTLTEATKLIDEDHLEYTKILAEYIFEKYSDSISSTEPNFDLCASILRLYSKNKSLIDSIIENKAKNSPTLKAFSCNKKIDAFQYAKNLVDKKIPPTKLSCFFYFISPKASYPKKNCLSF